MYLIIKPVEQEDDIIDIYIYKIDFFEHVYHRVFETEQEIYLASNENELSYFFVYEWKFCNKSKFEQLFLSKFDHIVFEFDYSDKSIRIIE